MREKGKKGALNDPKIYKLYNWERQFTLRAIKYCLFELFTKICWADFIILIIIGIDTDKALAMC